MQKINRDGLKELNQRKKNLNNATNINNIINEYNLKRNSFNPEQPSPNLFIDKLALRMKKYYTDLYNSDRRMTE